MNEVSRVHMYKRQILYHQCLTIENHIKFRFFLKIYHETPTKIVLYVENANKSTFYSHAWLYDVCRTTTYL